MNPEIVRPNLVGLGEVLWDVFSDADHFGGAPANFACHAAGLGGDAWVVSAVGRDKLGDDALASLSAKNVHTLLLQRNDHPTGTVTVTLDATKQASYVFAAEPAYGATSAAGFSALGLPGHGAAPAVTIFSWPSRARGGASAHRATAGAWRRPRRTWSITSFHRSPCGSG